MYLKCFASLLARKVSIDNLTLFHLKNLAFPVSFFLYVVYVRSKSWYWTLGPEKWWLWMLSEAEGTNYWNLGMQMPSKLEWICPLSVNTKTQVRCLNYQHGWKNQSSQCSAGLSVQYVLDVSALGHKWPGTETPGACFLLHHLEMFAIFLAPFVWMG